MLNWCLNPFCFASHVHFQSILPVKVFSSSICLWKRWIKANPPQRKLCQGYKSQTTKEIGKVSDRSLRWEEIAWESEAYLRAFSLLFVMSTIDWRFLPILPTIHMLKPDAQCDDIGRQGLWEVIRSRGWSFLYKWDQCPYKRDLRELPCPTSTWHSASWVWIKGQTFTRHQIYSLGSWISTPRTVK